MNTCSTNIQIKNKQKILIWLEKLKVAFEESKIPALHNHEVNPWLPKESRENFLYFIMTCCLNYQRNSPNTWKSALETWNDAETNFVFFPEKVILETDENLKKALLKHKLALQPVKHIQIWKVISHTFAEKFKNDPRKLFEKWDFDVMKILQIIQKDMKKGFPYLSWPKLSNYFLFILLEYTDIKLKNTQEISIIPDTHIMQATEKLWILKKEQIKPENVEIAWKDLLKNTWYAPIDFHSILWNWSRNKFKPTI